MSTIRGWESSVRGRAAERGAGGRKGGKEEGTVRQEELWNSPKKKKWRLQNMMTQYQHL